MTTVIIDFHHRKIVTDTQSTFTEKKWTLSGRSEKIVHANHDFIKVKPFEMNKVFVASGDVDTINNFIKNYKKGKLTKLKNSCVLLIENDYPLFNIDVFEKNRKLHVTQPPGYFIIGSGQTYAYGAMDGRDEEDEDRAYKSIITASKFDSYTNDQPYVFTFPSFDDIH